MREIDLILDNKKNKLRGDEVSMEPGVGKCYTQSGGNVVGSPTCEWVQSYAWVYVWPNKN